MQQGSKVRITAHGMFNNKTGTIVRMSAGNKAVVRIDGINHDQNLSRDVLELLK